MSLVEKQFYFSQLKYSWTWKEGKEYLVARVQGMSPWRGWSKNLINKLDLSIMKLVWIVSCLILLPWSLYHDIGAIDISPLCAVVDETVVDFVTQSCTVGRRLQMTCRDVHSLAPHLQVFRLPKLFVWRIRPPLPCWQRSCNPKSPNSLELPLDAPAVVGSGRIKSRCFFGQWVTKREKTKTTTKLVIIASAFEKQRRDARVDHEIK